MAPAELVTTQQIAQRLKVTPEAVRKWRSRGIFPAPDQQNGAHSALWRWTTVRTWATRTGRLERR